MKKKLLTTIALLVFMLSILSTTTLAELMDKDAEPAPVVSSGSFETTSGTRMDFSVSGGTLTGAKWSYIRHSASYSLTGTFKEGDSISISLSGTQAPGVDDVLVWNFLDIKMSFFDGNGNRVGEAQHYKSDRAKSSPMSHEITGSVPSGAKEVAVSGTFNCRWTTPNVVVEEGVGVFVNLVLEEEPKAVLPAEQKSSDTTPEPSAEKDPDSTSEQSAEPEPDSKAGTSAEPEPDSKTSVVSEPDSDTYAVPESDSGQDSSSTPESIPAQKPVSDQQETDEWDGIDPWTHAEPAASVLISAISAVAAIFGISFSSAAGAAGTATVAATGTATGTDVGSAENNDAAGETEDDLDPAYEAAKVPDYPEFVVGREGEHITKKPDGNIQVSYPSGDVATHFTNGTVQVKSPNGSTWEEWPDGTVSTTDENGTFIVKTKDGTMTAREPNGDEIVYNPDGTSVETKNNGLKITSNAKGETVTAERNGMVATRHPTDPDALVMTSPDGGSLVIRTEEKYEYVKNEKGKLEGKTVQKVKLEGEIRSGDATHIYRKDGSREVRGDDGSYYSEKADGSIDISLPDGNKMKYNAQTGESEFQFPDGSSAKININTGEIEYIPEEGSCLKVNTETGEVDAKLKDGSYWKRDAKGNGSFDDKENGVRGVCREDGFTSIESKEGSLTQQTDGTMTYQGNDGIKLVEKPDKTVTVSSKDGTTLVRNADGTGFLRKPDGTVSPLPPMPR